MHFIFIKKKHSSKDLYLNLHKWYTSQIGQNKVSLALAVYRSIFLYWHWYLHVLSCASVFVFFILFLFFFVFVFEFPCLLTHLAFADSPPGVQHSPVLSSSPSSNLINSTWKKLKSWKKISPQIFNQLLPIYPYLFSDHYVWFLQQKSTTTVR